MVVPEAQRNPKPGHRHTVCVVVVPYTQKDLGVLGIPVSHPAIAEPGVLALWTWKLTCVPDCRRRMAIALQRGPQASIRRRLK